VLDVVAQSCGRLVSYVIALSAPHLASVVTYICAAGQHQQQQQQQFATSRPSAALQHPCTAQIKSCRSHEYKRAVTPYVAVVTEDRACSRT